MSQSRSCILVAAPYSIHRGCDLIHFTGSSLSRPAMDRTSGCKWLRPFPVTAVSSFSRHLLRSLEEPSRFRPSVSWGIDLDVPYLVAHQSRFWGDVRRLVEPTYFSLWPAPISDVV